MCVSKTYLRVYCAVLVDVSLRIGGTLMSPKAQHTLSKSDDVRFGYFVIKEANYKTSKIPLIFCTDILPY